MLESSSYFMYPVNGDHALVPSVRKLIHLSFGSRLGASPNTQHEQYLVVEERKENGSKLVACSSLTSAEHKRLFSETYLDSSIEEILSNKTGFQVSRSQICEIGALSIDQNIIPAVKLLIAYFPWYAEKLGYKYALVTVTNYMRAALHYSGTPFMPICKANPNRLPIGEAERWGKYYDYDPETGIIDLTHMDFLNEVTIAVAGKQESIIRPGCFKGVQAWCS